MTGRTLPPCDKARKFTAEEDEAVGELPSSPIQSTSASRLALSSLAYASSSTTRIRSLPHAPSSTARGKAHAISPGHFDLPAHHFDLPARGDPPAQGDPPARGAHPAHPSRGRYTRNHSPSQSSSSSESDPPQSPLISQDDFNTVVRNLLAWRPPSNGAPAFSRAAPTSRHRAASPSQRH
jgi:hypothetical protein